MPRWFGYASRAPAKDEPLVLPRRSWRPRRFASLLLGAHGLPGDGRSTPSRPDPAQD
jgi:hypothetical protein